MAMVIQALSRVADRLVRHLIRLALFLLLALAATPATATKPIYANVGLIVRSEADGKPIADAKVALSFVDPAETAKDKVNVAGNSAQTDKQGFAAPRAYAGYIDKDQVSRVDVTAVRARVEAPGFKTFEGPARVFYIAWRAGGRLWVFVDEIHLVAENVTDESATNPQVFKPVASVEPLWGDYKTAFKLTVTVVTPEVVAHEFPKDVMRVSYMGRSDDPKKPEVELKDDGKDLDRAADDFVFSGIIRPPKDSGDQLVETIDLRLLPREDFHNYRPENGILFRWIESKSGLTFGGYFSRWTSVTAVIEVVPIRWAVADTVVRARDLYMDKFGVPVRPPAASSF